MIDGQTYSLDPQTGDNLAAKPIRTPRWLMALLAFTAAVLFTKLAASLLHIS